MPMEESFAEDGKVIKVKVYPPRKKHRHGKILVEILET